jgi:DHHC palmitoyltransferase
VGAKNIKFFLLFVLYTALAAAMLVLMMLISFYHLMTTKSKSHTQKDGYVLGFVLCIIAFIEGILFAFFCFELIQEQFEAIEVNQTYVDDMKDLFGRPLSLSDNLSMAIGHDWKWWLFPTTPVLSINYLEKMYTLKEIKKLKEFEEEDYDENRKLFAIEFIKASKEKKRWAALTVICVITWTLYLRY